MAWPSPAELDDLVHRFERAAVPPAEFTHAAHLVVGLWHVHRFGEEGLPRLRAGIRRLNAAHGTPDTDSRGYHETITRAYITLLTQFLAERRNERLAAAAQSLLASPLAARDALLAYYSRDVLWSVAARRDWLEPDRAPLRLDVLRGGAT